MTRTPRTQQISYVLVLVFARCWQCDAQPLYINNEDNCMIHFVHGCNRASVNADFDVKMERSHDEITCLRRPRELFEWCDNTRRQSISATFTPSGSSAAFPLEEDEVYAQAKDTLEVALVILTSSATCLERVPVMHRAITAAGLSTTGFKFHLLYFGDSGVRVGDAEIDGARFIDTDCGEGHNFPLVCKLAHSISWVAEHLPAVHWLFRASDDTYVNVHNLAAFAAHFPPDLAVFLGDVHVSQHFAYADGGPGFLLSRAAFLRAAEQIPAYLNIGRGDTDDTSFGKFMAEIGVEPLQGSPFIGELFCLVPQEGKSGRTDNQNTSFAEEGGVGSWVVDVCAGLNHSHLSHVALGRRAIVLAPWPRRVQTPITSLQQVFKGGLPHVHAFQQFGPHRSALLPSRPVSFHVRGFEQYGLLGLRCGEASDVERLHSAVQALSRHLPCLAAEDLQAAADLNITLVVRTQGQEDQEENNRAVDSAESARRGQEAQRACATSQDSCYRSSAENRPERLAKLLEARMASSPPPPWPLECYLEPHAGSRDMHWPGWKGQKRPVVIGSLATWIDLVGLDAQDLAACEVPCMILKVPRKAPRACVQMLDMLLVPNGVGLDAARSHFRPAWNRWAYFSMESGALYPEMDQEAHMGRFDLEISYRKSADLWLTYGPHDAEVVRSRDWLDEVAGLGRGAVLYLQSNCVPERDAVVRELMEYIQVDSMGKCLHTTPLPASLFQGDNFTEHSQLRLLARYKFVVTLENSRYVDYVTERVHNAWIAGSVPIYSGAPNIAQHAPHPHSYISLEDFESVAELAEYLLYLDDNHTAYGEYLRFKDPQVPLSHTYLEAAAHSMWSSTYENGHAGGHAAINKTSAAQVARVAAHRDTAAAPALDFRDSQCGQDGVASIDPRSRCFASLAKHSKNLQRGNALRGCRLCLAALGDKS